ncbi:MAG: class I SAM-dependent DNA methyltransferase, partial [Victivallales bacterium]|nr:class I SAM-dependent DNA methyltransferase [Victivallales bacterium]
MHTIPAEQKAAARDFVALWTGKGYERGQTQPFWLSLLRVLGIEQPEAFIEFEDKAHIDSAHGFIDGYIPATHVLVEQKSLGKSLRAGIQQSDGSVLTPFQQAKRYAVDLPYSRRPRWVVTCNFSEFLLYDMEKPNAEPESLLLSELPEQLHRLRFLVDTGSEALRREEEISRKAGDVVGLIYDALLMQYRDPSSPATLKSLNQLCVRLVFLLYAEDADVFAHLQFHDYLKSFSAARARLALAELFKVLDTPVEKRDKYLDSDLAAFPYVNGGLFSDESVDIPQFTDDILDLLLRKASENFDWKDISPTIFGAMFESTLNPETRRSGGMHYTSVANIHKVIDPLFLDELKAELSDIKAEPNAKRQAASLRAYIDRLGTLNFLDPACGSGNFLTETYISLRRLENEALSLLLGRQGQLDLEGNMIRVSLAQFHGFEINDFACHVAQTALWIAENQMLRETERIARRNLEFLPLKEFDGIVEGNALHMDWGSIGKASCTPTIKARRVNLIEGEPPEEELNIPPLEVHDNVAVYDTVNVYTKEVHLGKERPEPQSFKYDYIFGNPPFVGYSFQTAEQKVDILALYRDKKGRPYKTAGKIDYVAGWYWKAAEYMAARPATRTAFVSTNSITQGEQVSAVWRPLVERFGVAIDFAHRTFRWDSESNSKARVHCVIVGFSVAGNGIDGTSSKALYDGERVTYGPHINAYLLPAPDIWIESRHKPLCNVLNMVAGNRPADGGHLIIEASEIDDFLKREPEAKLFIRRLVGAQEFINNKPRYCLWLVEATPTQLRTMPLVLERIRLCREDRMAAPDEGRRKLAEKPALFRETQNPASFILVPRVSSENRRYIPIGFLDAGVICSDSNMMLPSA